MPDCEMRPECKIKFEQIEERLQEGNKSFRAHREALHANDLQLAELKTNMRNLIKSMDHLTKGIWGMVMAIAGEGIAFVIWFIQSK